MGRLMGALASRGAGTAREAEAAELLQTHGSVRAALDSRS